MTGVPASKPVEAHEDRDLAHFRRLLVDEDADDGRPHR
jgi:hypothetical protein